MELPEGLLLKSFILHAHTVGDHVWKLPEGLIRRPEEWGVSSKGDSVRGQSSEEGAPVVGKRKERSQGHRSIRRAAYAPLQAPGYQRLVWEFSNCLFTE